MSIHAQPSEGSTITDQPTLARNLAALGRVDPRLIQRLSWPAASDHLVAEGEGVAYHLHGARVPLGLTAELARAAADEAGDAGEVLAFGVGLGETVAALLEDPRRRVVAYERDPAVLALALASTDVADALGAGRLSFRLGVDLALGLGALPAAMVPHPLLSRVYHLEGRMLDAGPPVGGWGAVAVGGLFVDDLADCLRARGLGVWPVDVRRWSLNEVEHTLRALRPAALICVNHVHGLAELCQAWGVALRVWEIDPSTDRVRPVQGPVPGARIFTYRRAHVAAFEEAGFAGARYLPLAANPRRRRPAALSPEERARYEAPVAFVGSSMVTQARRSRRQLERLYLGWWRATRGEAGAAEAARRASESIDRILAEQRRTPARYRIPELMEAAFGSFLAELPALGVEEDPCLLAAESAAAERRLSYVASLGGAGIHVWGDAHWEAATGHGAAYRGPAGHDRELTAIYTAAHIHVDIGRLYQLDIVTMRVFDVLACGGFLIAEHCRALAELFEVGVEVESYRSLSELSARIAHYQAHPQQARAIAERGRRAVLERHCMDDRLEMMLSSAPEERPQGGGDAAPIVPPHL